MNPYAVVDMQHPNLENGIKMELPPLLLTHKRNTKSIVWEYFGLECSEDGSMKDRDMAVCNICLKRISAKGGNTSNLFQHVGVHHPEEYAIIRDKKLTCYGTPRNKDAVVVPEELHRKVISVSPAPKIRKRKLPSGISSGHEMYLPSPSHSTAAVVGGKPSGDAAVSPKHSRMTEHILYFLAKELVSPDIMNSSGFRRLLNGFDSHYPIPDGQYFRVNSFPGFYSGLRTTIAEEVSRMSFFSATIDILPLPGDGGGSYLIFSVHFINDNWVLKHCCLITMYVPPKQAIEATADGLISLLVPWNLPPEKLTCAITKESRDLTKILEYLGWPQLPCFGSRLHQAVNSALESDSIATQSINDCRNLTASFLQNVEKKRNLWKVKEELDLSDYSLQIDRPGSWQSTQEMMSSVIKLEPAIRKVLTDIEEPLLDGFPLFKAVNAALEVITEITGILTSEHYVTLSSIKPLLHLMTTSILAVAVDDHEVTKNLKKHIAETLVANYQEYRCQVVLNIATHLDPRFKALFSDQSQAENVSEILITEGVENFQTTNSNGDGDVKAESAESELSKGKQGGVSTKKRKSLGKLLEELKTASDIETPPTKILRKELNSYLSAPKVDSECNPLDWWKLQSGSYPNLAILARKYLSVCATSAPSENLFNQRDESPFLSGMLKDPEEVNMAIFLSRNLQSTL